MKLIFYILEQIIITLINNILISNLINIDISNLILFNGISVLIYLLLNNNNLFPVSLEINFILIPIILLFNKYNNYKYNFIISGFTFLGIIFYIISMHINIKNLIKINLFLPKSIIITNIILIILEFFRIFYNQIFLNSKNNLLNILILYTVINLLIFKKIFKNIKFEIILFINIIINFITLNYFNYIEFNYYKLLPIFKLPTIYKYSLNFKSIIIILPFIFIFLIEHISYITILNIKNNKFLTTEKINKSFFANSISILIASLFGSLPCTISEKNIINNNKNINKINNIKKKNIHIFLSIIYIIISFINILNITKFIPIYIIYGAFIYIYISILLSSINILIKNLYFKDLIIIMISLIIYILNINNIYRISLSLIISLIFNIIYLHIFYKNEINIHINNL